MSCLTALNCERDIVRSLPLNRIFVDNSLLIGTSYVDGRGRYYSRQYMRVENSFRKEQIALLVVNCI